METDSLRSIVSKYRGDIRFPLIFFVCHWPVANKKLGGTFGPLWVQVGERIVPPKWGRVYLDVLAPFKED